MTIDKEALRKLAEAARLGWYEADYLFRNLPVMPMRDAAYMAAAKPAAVLSILSELDAKDAEIARLREALTDLIDAGHRCAFTPPMQLPHRHDDLVKAVANARAALSQKGASHE